ncbi:MAG: VOC family protein [Streptosporangiales bacterium]|nr:VOC family protein [Streptosporangiales bacterium]
MTDPLEVLRQPLVPLEPDPAFAARLRNRVRRALTEGETMTASAATVTAADGDIVYLSLRIPDADRARDFYRAVLGWRFGTGDDRPGTPHEQNSRQVQGQAIHIGIWNGQADDGVGNPGIFIVRRVADLATAIGRVRELGGTATEPFQNEHGVMSNCRDDQGNAFTLVEMPGDEPRSPLNGERPGDIVYITMSPGDEERGSRFYGDLFGWEFTPGHVARGLNVDGPRPMTGMWGGTGRPLLEPVYGVADIAVAVRRIRELGGTATDPHREPYGLAAEGTDDQGLSFGLMQLG